MWKTAFSKLEGTCLPSNFLKAVLHKIYLVHSWILCLIWSFRNSVYDCHKSKGIKFITRLRLSLSHLHEHKLKHNFQDPVYRLCSCGHDVETTTNFFFYCSFVIIERRTLFTTVSSVDATLLGNTGSVLFY